jgi:hypothetical protein
VSDDRPRLNLRTTPEIVARIEAISAISGESKNVVGNVLIAMALCGNNGTTLGETKTGGKMEEPQETSMVQPDSDKKPSGKSGATSEKVVSSSPTPPTPSPISKEKDIPKGISKKKGSSPKKLGDGRKPKNFEECLEYFQQRGIPSPREKAERFWSHYESNGWKVGKNPVSKWGMCLTTWIANNPDWKPQKSGTTCGTISLEDVLKWMKEERPPYYEKFKDVKKLDEIDGYYIDEYKASQ